MFLDIHTFVYMNKYLPIVNLLVPQHYEKRKVMSEKSLDRKFEWEDSYVTTPVGGSPP